MNTNTDGVSAMSVALEALPCPFCGSTNISAGEVLTETPGGKLFTQSECRGCGALGPNGPLKPGQVDYGDIEAIRAWNRRSSNAKITG